jgi:hypothetical protein
MDHAWRTGRLWLHGTGDTALERREWLHGLFDTFVWHKKAWAQALLARMDDTPVTLLLHLDSMGAAALGWSDTPGQAFLSFTLHCDILTFDSYIQTDRRPIL